MGGFTIEFELPLKAPPPTVSSNSTDSTWLIRGILCEVSSSKANRGEDLALHVRDLTIPTPPHSTILPPQFPG